ncbi:MAG: thioredoxin family protein [Thermodesulfobacteriota bacterium]
MNKQNIVSKEEWLKARKELLTKEKEFSKLRDQLSQERRQLPWVKVEKNYVFETTQGKESLSDLFKGKSQLIIYHFMFGPDWEQGCPSCSFLSDSIDGTRIHLNHRDINLIVVSRAKLDKLQAYKKRMGWDFKWVSSFGSDFNFDYNVSFKSDEPNESRHYNFETAGFLADEGPGVSVFVKDEEGEIFHAYSSYARGLDLLIGTYNYIDLTPKGRDEDALPFTMAWIRRHDQYED